MAANVRLANCISAHAWNADCSMLAISPNTPEVWIYTNCHSADPSTWERRYVLAKHDSVVSALDWHPVTNKLVTCSHDRSAFVWELRSGAAEWEPQITILPHRMACMDVRWSPDGLKFAVASGSKKALIAFYEPTNNWWVARESRSHRSSVLSLAWHPSSQLLATVSADYKCRVLSAFVEGVDAAPATGTPFGALPAVAGEVLSEYEITRAWVNDVAWSPSGTALAFAGHDSLLHIVTFSGTAQPLLQTIKCPTLPAMRLIFLSEAALITAGHSLNPELYVCSASASASAGGAGSSAAALPLWSFATYLDKRPDASAGAKAVGGVAAARAMFASKSSKGTSGGGAGGGGGDTDLWTKHQNAIMGIRGYSRKAAAPGTPIKAVSTTGIDGRLVVWDLTTVEGVDLKAAGLA